MSSVVLPVSGVVSVGLKVLELCEKPQVVDEG